MFKRVLFFGLLLIASSVEAQEETKERVDLLLVLATDVSDSISKREFELQKDGIVAALQSDEVHEAIASCADNGIALNYMEWAGEVFKDQTKEVVPWTKVKDKTSLRNFAQRVNAAGRSFEPGNTDIETALKFSKELLEKAPFSSPRWMVDLSSDGVQNISKEGPLSHDRLAFMRDSLINHTPSITVNTLVIFDPTETDLYAGHPEPVNLSHVNYFKTYVEGGFGSFTVAISSFEEFGQAMAGKLAREICSMAVAAK